MPKDSAKMQKKRQHVERLYDLLGKYTQIIQVSLANVTSKQYKTIHKDIRENGGHLIVLKNSLFRKAVDFRVGGPDFVKPEKFDWAKSFVKDEPMEELANLRPLLKQQCGYIFTNEPVFELKPRIENFTVPAAAKAGLEAQCDVVIPPGPTGMDPSQISFFHALQITTKIQKGQIEIQKEYQVAKKGVKVGASQVQLLKSMNMKPFTYGMQVYQMYDSGTILDNETCSLSPADLLDSFKQGVQNITALSLETGYITEVSAPHAVISAFKNILSIGLETGYNFDFLEKIKSQGPATTSSAPAKQDAKKEEAPKVEEKEEEEEVDLGGGGLFGDDDDF